MNLSAIFNRNYKTMSILVKWATPLCSMKEMTNLFTNYNVNRNGKMIKLNQHQHQAPSTSCAPDPTTQQRRLSP